MASTKAMKPAHIGPVAKDSRLFIKKLRALPVLVAKWWLRHWCSWECVGVPTQEQKIA